METHFDNATVHLQKIWTIFHFWFYLSRYFRNLILYLYSTLDKLALLPIKVGKYSKKILSFLQQQVGLPVNFSTAFWLPTDGFQKFPFGKSSERRFRLRTFLPTVWIAASFDLFATAKQPNEYPQWTGLVWSKKVNHLILVFVSKHEKSHVTQRNYEEVF